MILKDLLVPELHLGLFWTPHRFSVVCPGSPLDLSFGLWPLLPYLCVALNLFILFTFDCIGSLLLHAGFLELWRAGPTLHCGARASVVVALGLSSCGSLA